MPHSTRCYRFACRVDSKELGESIQKEYRDLLVQTVDSAAVSNERLVEMIGEQTIEARGSGSSLARKPELDLLMRLAGTTQIARAIQEVGVKRDKDFLLLVIGENSEMAKLEAREASAWERLPRRELGREDLQKIERAALLDAERA